MADKKLSIEITAKDGSAAVFKQVASEASKIGPAVEQSTAKANSAFDALKAHAAALTSLLSTTGVSALREFAAAGEQNAQAQRQLEAAIANTGHTWGDYAAAIEKATSSAAQLGISDDKATNALQALTEITGNAGTALGLLSTAEDLAAAKHMDLVTAAELVGKAYEGNTGMLARYGILVQQGASGTEVMAELQAKFGGQAAANTTVLSRYTAEFENFKGRVGEAMGPVAGLITLLPGISAGYQIAATAGGALIDVLRAQRAAAEAAAVAMDAEAASAEGAAAATAGVSAAGEAGLLASLAGPAGIIAAAAAAAGGLILLARHTDEYRTAAEAAASDTQKLAAAIAQLQAGGGSPTAVAGLKSITDEWTALDIAAAKYNNDLRLASQQAGNPIFQQPESALSPAQLAQKQAILQAQKDIANGEQALREITDANANAIQADITAIYNHPGVNPDKANAAIHDLFAQFENGTLSADDLKTSLDNLNAGWASLTDQTASASAQVQALLTNLDKMTSDAKAKWTDSVNPLKDIPAILEHIDTSFDATAVAAQRGADLVTAAYKTALDAAAGDPAKVKAATDEYVRSMFALNDILTHAEAATAGADQEMASFNQTLDYAGIAANETGSSLDHLRAQFPRLADAASNLHHSLAAVISDLAAQGTGGPTIIDALANAHQPAATAVQQVESGWNNVTAAIHRAGAAIGDLTRNTDKERDAALAAAEANAKAIVGTPTFTQAAAGLPNAGAAATAAAGIASVNSELADMTRIVIDNTAAIAQNSDKLFKWADDLIGAEGVYSKLDDLVAKGKITGQSGVFTGNSEYAQAQQAYNAIAKDNLRIQEATLVIQAKQAPLLADLADKQAAYLEKVEGMKPAEQLAALGFLDANEQIKAQNTIALAAAAAQGKLGKEGEKAATAVINGAVQADPVLKEMLNTMGLITEHKDGTFTLNMQGFETAQTAIDNLDTDMKTLVGLFKDPIVVRFETPDEAAAREAFDTLKLHIDALPRNTSLTAATTVIGQSEIDAMKTSLGNLPPHTDPVVNVTVNGAGAIDDLRNGIDGLYSKDVYVNAYQTTYQQTIDLGRNTGYALGGVIPAYAFGGVTARLAEAGPELLDFPSGLHGLALSNGLYNVPPGTFVHTAPATKAAGFGPSRYFIHNGNVINYPATGDDAARRGDAALAFERRV